MLQHANYSLFIYFRNLGFFFCNKIWFLTNKQTKKHNLHVCYHSEPWLEAAAPTHPSRRQCAEQLPGSRSPAPVGVKARTEPGLAHRTKHSGASWPGGEEEAARARISARRRAAAITAPDRGPHGDRTAGVSGIKWRGAAEEKCGEREGRAEQSGGHCMQIMKVWRWGGRDDGRGGGSSNTKGSSSKIYAKSDVFKSAKTQRMIEDLGLLRGNWHFW